MRRRDVVVCFGAAAAWPLTVQAQSGTPRTVGFLDPGSARGPRTATFAQRLRELGWIDGQNLVIEYRAADGLIDRARELLSEFVRLKVDVIVTNSTTFALAAKQATSAIPIVFASAPDPVGAGLVSSLARPGGNLTGFSTQQIDVAGKRIELLREIIPGVRRLAVLAADGSPSFGLARAHIEGVAPAMKLEFAVVGIRRIEDIAGAVEGLKGQADALYVAASPLFTESRTLINTAALAARLPTSHPNREYLQGGGLVSYGPDVMDLFRRAGDLVDKILRGSKPADLPVEQPTKFELVVNLRTAKALGIVISPAFLARADEVIE